MDATMKLMLVVGWTGMLAGGLSGAALGLGFLNLLFAFTWGVAGLGGAS